MNELTHRPYFGVEGYDGVHESPFDAVEAALDWGISGGDERPDTVRVELYVEERIKAYEGDVRDLAYGLAEDLTHERERFEECLRLISERLTWAIETCHAGTFDPAWRYFDVRTIGDDDEWDIDRRDVVRLSRWWAMEIALLRGGE